MQLLFSILINAIGLVVLVVPLWLLGSKNTSISMRPDGKDGFYTYAWFYENTKSKILDGEAYKKGAEIGTPQGQKYLIKDVEKSRYLLGMQTRYDFEIENLG
ncbi:hypothetical protein [Companilactobacillus hulinensis]|uniref:hypothetical protein n=1 Tax=Companilactobacillus hulinensis TaxID=2486007 RepID=UPI000F77EB83|nr:hypothetical protein [Companilactobacillus hulinensis]